MKRKSIMIVLGLCMLCLFGCGDRQQSSTGEAVSTDTIFTGDLEENGTIRVLENDTAIERGYLDELISAFNEAYADYGITAVDANMDQYLDLANDGPYGYGPDVLYQANDCIMKYVQGKHILPLPVESMECYSQISENAWDAYKADVDGTTYTMGVPVNVQAPVLFYRKDMLPEDWETAWDEDGNKVPDMLESWNAMYKYSIYVHEQDSTKYGYMKSLYDSYFSDGFLFSYGAYVFGENNTDPSDIGFAAGEAEKGAWVIKQLASIMSEECIDDTITTNSYSKMADGTYFATITTPDVYTTFINEMVLEYEEQGMTKEEATAAAYENLTMTSIPKLPASGDLSEENPKLIDSIRMGGVNGYAISAYTKSPNACLAFVEFATSYEMVTARNEYLGITPARADVAAQVGGMSQQMFDDMDSGNIVPMPSITEVGQIWTPMETFFTDVAKDAFRTTDEKYTDLASFKSGLETAGGQIHDAIYTLAN